MPVNLSFEEPSLFVLRAFEVVTYVEVRHAIDQLLADVRLRTGAGVFIDNRGVTRTPSIAEVALITRQFGKVFARGATRVALLTDSQAVYAVSQLFSSFASTVGADAKVFRDERQARQWVLAVKPVSPGR